MCCLTAARDLQSTQYKSVRCWEEHKEYLTEPPKVGQQNEVYSQVETKPTFQEVFTKLVEAYLSLFVDIAAIHCLEQQILCDICVDENSHKCTICHHKLKTNNFALKTYHVIVDGHHLQQQIRLFIKAHQPMFLTFTAPHLTYL